MRIFFPLIWCLFIYSFFVFKIKKRKYFIHHYNSSGFCFWLFCFLHLINTCFYSILVWWHEDTNIHTLQILSKIKVKECYRKNILTISRVTIIFSSIPSPQFEIIRNSVLFYFPNIYTKALKKTKRIILLISP